VRRSDAEVFLEAGDLVGLESREGVGETGGAGEEDDEGEQETAERRRHRVVVVDALRLRAQLPAKCPHSNCLFGLTQPGLKQVRSLVKFSPPVTSVH